MKDHQGKVVYVGKAKNLKNRIRQYFTPSTSDTRFFVKNLVLKISGIDTVITSSEKEAILLEYNLIHRYMPRYNIRLTDDKRFLHLRLNPKEQWPKLLLVRRAKKDGALYFGPYHFAKSARETVKLVNRHFMLRTCKDSTFKNRTRPCLQYQIKRCAAPCTLPVDKKDYDDQVTYVRMFLEGRREELLKQLVLKMNDAAMNLEYETASIIRDQIAAVKDTLAPQKIAEITDRDRDVIGIYREGSSVSVAVMNFIEGHLMGMNDFYFKDWEFSNEEFLSSFISQHYSRTARFPDEIIIPFFIDDMQALGEFVSDNKGTKVRVLFPRRGKRVSQVQMSNANAAELFKTKTRNKMDVEYRLKIVQKKLGLSNPPVIIECVDIAHFAGTNTVGAISCLVDASVDSSRGRIFRIKTAAPGDDFASMYEVLKRRFIHAKQSDKGWDAPDLLVVDGGKGQLKIAQKVLEELGMDSQPVVALAKERSDTSNEPSDRIFLPERMNPIPLRPTSPLVILAAARDEAHRLANGFQSKTRRKAISKSKLDTIDGLGPVLKKELLRTIGSVKKIKLSSKEDLLKVKGVGSSMAQKIVDTFNIVN